MMNISRESFLKIFFLTLVFKILLAVEIPMTGDEALFLVWSKDLSWGYYDHPPAIGWVLALMTKISTAIYVVRLPAVLLNHLIVFGIIDLINRWSLRGGQAYLAGAIYLLLPVSLLNVLVTNDTALTLFTFISSYLFLLASFEYEKNRYQTKLLILLYVGAGIFLGLGFLSKYLAVLLILPFIAIALRVRNWNGIFITLISSLPFPIINLVWNLENCWQNIQFNLVNRLEDKVTPWVGVSSYLVTLAYVLTPWLIFYVWKNRQRIKNFPTIALLAFIPFLLFGILSIRQLIGLHWIPALIPVFIVLIGLTLDARQLEKIKKWTSYLTVIHALLILALVYVPVGAWKEFKFYERLALLKNSKEVAKVAVANLPEGAIFMTRGYSTSSIFAYYLDSRVPVFGMGSKFGRHDDLNFDFKKIDGQPIRIFDNSPVQLEDFKPYFETVAEVTFTYEGINYRYVEGKGFKYEAYREGFLKKIAQKFYQFPAYLPECKCEFLERYDLKEANKGKS